MGTREIIDNPDLFDAIFEYVVTEFPELQPRVDELKDELRREFSGFELYIPRRSLAERKRRTDEVLALFNGRNATEVARRLGIGRATVYRIIKQAGGSK